MKIKQFFKRFLNWNVFLISVILLIMATGIVLIVKSGDSSNNIALGCGTGLISSGIVSLIVELIHITSTMTTNKRLRALFYNNIKQFISEFLYYASFYLDKSNLTTLEMLDYESKYYKIKPEKFIKLSQKKQDKLLSDIHFLVKQRRNFKLFFEQIDIRMYESVIHGVIDIETEKRIEYLIYDYNWIVNSFNDGKSLDVIPEAYSNLLKSVSDLIEKDKQLSMFNIIKFYSVKENKKIAGHIKEKDFKKLSKQDQTYLYQFSID